MSNLIPEGTYPVRVVGKASVGKNQKEETRARVNVEFIDGPGAGRRMTYDERIDPKSAKFVRGSLAAVGWKGKTFASVPVDVVEGAETTAEVMHLTVKDGPRAGEVFAKLRNLGGAPALDELSPSDLADADSLIAGADSDIPF